jgi:prepilin-type N-terminal cleavage/methylation domain-containing protein
MVTMCSLPPSPPPLRRVSPAFSLIELLAVLAVVAILAGLLLPVTTQVRGFALKVRTRAMFAQWTVAVEQFRADTGAYPQLGDDGRLDPVRFLAALCGQTPEGGPAAVTDLQGNLRRARYLSLAPEEWLGDGRGGGVLLDAFANSQIAVLLDLDGDGLIRGDELLRPPLMRGNPQEGFIGVPASTEPDIGVGGVIRAAVAFYSVGRGQSGDDYVFSWK